MKKIKCLTEGMENTHEMRPQKIEQHNTEPDNDLQEYILYSEIRDEDIDEETNFVAIFAIIGWCGMDPKDTHTQ